MFRLTLAALAAAALLAAGCGDDDSAGAEDGSGAADTAMKDEKEDAAMKKEAAMKEEEAAMKEKKAAAEDAMAAKRGAAVKVVRSEFGRVIADKRGEAVYLFDREAGRRSRCYGECAVAWPPLLTKGKPRAGKGADADLLGTTRRRNGKLQVTYNGHPLYYYKDDEPGRILCHNVDEFGGLWLVVNPRGDAVS
jgi:predicted lipoprotein with Yx(FWY)xxD motif